MLDSNGNDAVRDLQRDDQLEEACRQLATSAGSMRRNMMEQEFTAVEAFVLTEIWFQSILTPPILHVVDDVA